jgi:5'(3')-deoxyribonucleotidase
MSKLVFLLDVDEVLANFVTPAIAAISQVLGRPWSLAEAPADDWDMFKVLTEEQYDEMSRLIDVEGWCRSIEPYPDTKPAVAKLKSRCDIVVVTKYRHTPYWVYERTEWLGEHFGFSPDHIIYTWDKTRIDGDFLLDDHPGNVRSWQAAHPDGVGMFWSTEHNTRLAGHEDIRIKSWEAVIETVDRCT